jgi:capsular exopolysaccharide synthesis family protein
MTVVPTRDQSPQIVRPSTAGGRRGAAPASSVAGVPVVGPVAAPHGAGMTGRDVMRIVLKRKWFILLMLVVCSGASVAATMLWLRYAPMYTSAALMEVRFQMSDPLAPRVEPQQTAIDTMAKTYVNLIKSESVLRAAVDRPAVRATTWFVRNKDEAVRRLMEDVLVTPIPTTKLVRISMTGRNPRELPEIINAVAEAAQNDAMEMVNRSTRDQIRQLQTEREEIIQQRDRVRNEKARLLREADIPGMQDRNNVLTDRLRRLDTEVRQMERQLAMADNQFKQIQEQVKNGTITTLPDVVQMLDADPVLRSLQAGLLNSESERENLLRKFGPGHRSVANFEARVAAMKQQHDDRRKQLLQTQVGAMTTNAEAHKQLVLVELTKLREDYRFVDASLRGLNATLNAFDQFTRNENDLSASIGRIDSRLVELRISLKGDSPLTLRREAFTPDSPSHPQWAIMVPLGVLAGLVLGFGLAFLLELVDTSIKGPGDMVRKIDLPLLGMIPHGNDLEEEIHDLRLAFASHPNSLMSEAFRHIRTCLQFSGPASQRRTLLVTSSLPEDGRTTVSLNLGASIARGGRKVLVVDANFRQPSLKSLFPQCPDGGLSSALVGQANWRDMIFQVEPNLHIVAAGPLPPNPAELLGSDQMSNVVADMLSDYDQVLFDTAPCLLVTDAAALATQVDGVVIVVRAGANTHGIVTRTREMLNRIGAHVVGIILNGVRTVSGGYLRKNYDAFYEYQERSLPRR